MQLFYYVKKCQLPRPGGPYGDSGDLSTPTISRKIKPIPNEETNYDIDVAPLNLKRFHNANFPMNYRDSC